MLFFAASHTPELLKEDISNAKRKGAKQILLSVGGANNTYNPGKTPSNELAKNIVSFLNEYGFTGIDFDLEIDGDGEYLDELCQALKNVEPSLVITAAPQLNQGAHETDLILVSAGNCRMYDQAVRNNRFDYLFIQAYNNQWPVINDTNETDVEFISNSFTNLTKKIFLPKPRLPLESLQIDKPREQVYLPLLMSLIISTSLFTTNTKRFVPIHNSAVPWCGALI